MPAPLLSATDVHKTYGRGASRFDNRHTRLMHLLEENHSCTGLAGPLLGEDAVGARDDVEGQVDILGDAQPGHCCTQGSSDR